ncbi:hypothetical protein VMCG_09372 [Cytospora schulzeri]|uniref:Uncharacterized protein n=1 Tax=Cytospora schulzeri TaxID=448051 RepID=A0A423VJQ5_9PEZI|nr:hypothetical protein VMCG_09372 [Valsa malicola]
MPRRRASRSPSQDLEQQQQQQPQQQQPQSQSQSQPARRSSNQAGGIEAVFFGETSSMHVNHDQNLVVQNGDGDGDDDGNAAANVDGDVEMSRDGQQEVDTAVVPGGSNGTPTRGRASKRKHIDYENTPINMNELRLRQLKEDRDAFSYDASWCQDVLDADGLTPAESRTFQMRLLDLGHQLRFTNHRIAEYESEMQNMRYFGAPGSSSSRPLASYTTAYNPRTSFMNAEPPQERRGPGRPPGSKNRPKDAISTPQVPSSNAQKAAALASAGAKRTLPTEIRVATPNGGASENPNKRPRIEVGSPIGSTTEDDNEVNETANTAAVEGSRLSPEEEDEKDETIKTTNARRTQNRDTTKEDDRAQNGSAFTVVNNNNKKNINASSGGAPSAPSTPSQALPTRSTPSSKNSNMGPPPPAAASQTPAGAAGGDDPTEPDPTGPSGSKYQRLGHHMCQLCTSQKYLQQTTPKQPSEPSSWPLRDISKMVTHYTRMHGEHNKMERCMELGRALEDNRGPFRYWLQETKRVKVSLDEVNEAINELHQGHLPDLLRRLSNAARGFPKD